MKNDRSGRKKKWRDINELRHRMDHMEPVIHIDPAVRKVSSWEY